MPRQSGDYGNNIFFRASKLSITASSLSDVRSADQHSLCGRSTAGEKLESEIWERGILPIVCSNGREVTLHVKKTKWRN